MRHLHMYMCVNHNTQTHVYTDVDTRAFTQTHKLTSRDENLDVALAFVLIFINK